MTFNKCAAATQLCVPLHWVEEKRRKSSDFQLRIGISRQAEHHRRKPTDAVAAADTHAQDKSSLDSEIQFPDHNLNLSDLFRITDFLLPPSPSPMDWEDEGWRAAGTNLETGNFRSKQCWDWTTKSSRRSQVRFRGQDFFGRNPFQTNVCVFLLIGNKSLNPTIWTQSSHENGSHVFIQKPSSWNREIHCDIAGTCGT